MNKEEIIDIVMQIGMCDRPEDDSPALKMFISFAKRIAEKEREECVKRASVALLGTLQTTTDRVLKAIKGEKIE